MEGNNKSEKDINNGLLKNVSFHELIDFKEDLLKLIKEMKTELHKKINEELLN